MARNDGVDRTSARNRAIRSENVKEAQKHNEREKEAYSNADIVPERSALNVHYKTPSDSYEQIFDELLKNKIISTRGQRADGVHFDELVFDVNSAYFHNHGGYEYAKQFYADAYKAAVDIVGGEDFVVSAVMHADERNSAMSEALGEDVYHYHLHVVYIPVVEKQILWSKRCKDETLRGTVKETIMQVSNSKKWESRPAVDEQGKLIRSTTGKPVLQKSYSVLQDEFFRAMRAAGYEDVERGERGSTEEHLTVTQFKVMKEKEHLEAVTEQLTQTEQTLLDTKTAAEKQKQKLEVLQKKTKTAKTIALAVQEIEAMGKSQKLTGNTILTSFECDTLKNYAVKGIMASAENKKLKILLAEANRSAEIWKKRFEELQEKARPYLDALEIASGRVKAFISSVLEKTKENRNERQTLRGEQEAEMRNNKVTSKRQSKGSDRISP